MEHIRTETAIAAPPERVWSILVDFGRYPEWNPLIVDMRGWAEAGAPLDFRVVLGGRRLPVNARVLRADKPRELRWRGPRSRLAGLAFSGEHYFQIEPAPEGCRLIHGEDFRGWTVPLVWPRVGPAIREGYAAMDAALKRRAERGD